MAATHNCEVSFHAPCHHDAHMLGACLSPRRVAAAMDRVAAPRGAGGNLDGLVGVAAYLLVVVGAILYMAAGCLRRACCGRDADATRAGDGGRGAAQAAAAAARHRPGAELDAASRRRVAIEERQRAARQRMGGAGLRFVSVPRGFVRRMRCAAAIATRDVARPSTLRRAVGERCRHFR